MKSEVLDRVPSSDLRVFIVWLPILYRDTKDAAVEAAALVPDARASHFYDATMELSNALGEALQIPASSGDSDPRFGHAWDVYLAYPLGARWISVTPPRTFWMHQLTVLSPAKAPRLDGAALRAHVEGLLAPTAKAP